MGVEVEPLTPPTPPGSSQTAVIILGVLLGLSLLGLLVTLVLVVR